MKVKFVEIKMHFNEFNFCP